MALKIRLSRVGTRANRYYRVVVAENARRVVTHRRADRRLQPARQGQRADHQLDRVDYWVSKGAKPTATMHSMIGAPARPRPPRSPDRCNAEIAENAKFPSPSLGAIRVCFWRAGFSPCPPRPPRLINFPCASTSLTLFPAMLDGFLSESMMRRQGEAARHQDPQPPRLGQGPAQHDRQPPVRRQRQHGPQVEPVFDAIEQVATPGCRRRSPDPRRHPAFAG